MNKIFNRENFGFGGLQWLYWGGYATVFPFLVIYLKSKGYNEVQTGAVMAAMVVVSVFAQPFWGSYCDRKRTVRDVLAVCLLVSGIITLFIPVFYRSFGALIFLVLIISFTENSMSSLIDSWTVHTAINKPWLDYGLTRGMGSLGFAFTALLFGALLDRFGYGLMFPTHLFVIGLFIACCFYVEKRNKFADALPASDREKKEHPRFRLKGSGKFIWFLVSSTLVFIGFRATLTFYPILLSQQGGNNMDLGLSFFILALCEAPLFFLSKRIMQKYKDTAVILTAMVFFIVKILLHIVVVSVPGLIAVQATQLVSFGLFLPASVYYIMRIAPEGLSTTYLTIAVSCYSGISAIIGNFGGGLIIDWLGIYPMLWFGTALTVAGTLVFLFSTCIAYNRQPEGEPAGRTGSPF